MTTRKAALEASALRSSTIKGEAKVRLCARGRRDRPRRRPTRLATAEHPRAEQVGGQAPPDGDGHPLPGTTRLARVRRAPVGYPLRGRLRGHPRHVRHGADEHGMLQPPLAGPRPRHRGAPSADAGGGEEGRAPPRPSRRKNAVPRARLEDVWLPLSERMLVPQSRHSVFL